MYRWVLFPGRPGVGEDRGLTHYTLDTDSVYFAYIRTVVRLEHLLCVNNTAVAKVSNGQKTGKSSLQSATCT